MTHDQQFLGQHAESPVDLFPRGPLRYLVGMAQWYWRLNQEVLTDQTVSVVTEDDKEEQRRHGTTEEAALKTWLVLDEYAIDPSTLPIARTRSRKWLERRLIRVVVEKAEAAVQEGDLDRARALLTSNTLATQSLDNLMLGPGAEDFLKAMRLPRPGAIATGFTSLDRLWEGGYRPGELGMIVAPTGIGKSMGLCKMAAVAAWAGASVLYYTFELTPTEIRDRIALAIIERGKRSTRKTWAEELAEAAARNKMATVPQFSIDVRGDSITWPDLTSDLEAYKQATGHYPDVLLLDSADDVAPFGNYKTTWESLKAAFTFMRLNIAKDKGIRVWTSGQLTRESVDKARTSLKNIGDAFAKAQKSHYVLGFAQTQTQRVEEPHPLVNLYVLKDSLHGTVGGTLELSVDFGRGDNGFPGFTEERTFDLPD